MSDFGWLPQLAPLPVADCATSSGEQNLASAVERSWSPPSNGGGPQELIGRLVRIAPMGNHSRNFWVKRKANSLAYYDDVLPILRNMTQNVTKDRNVR
jgi:hypothetical protein